MRALAFVAPGCSALRHPLPPKKSNTINNNKNKKLFFIRQGPPYVALLFLRQVGASFLVISHHTQVTHCANGQHFTVLSKPFTSGKSVTSNFGNNSFTLSSHISLVKFVILKISYLFYLFSFNFLSMSSHTHQVLPSACFGLSLLWLITLHSYWLKPLFIFNMNICSCVFPSEHGYIPWVLASLPGAVINILMKAT